MKYSKLNFKISHLDFWKASLLYIKKCVTLFYEMYIIVYKFDISNI